MMNKLLLLIIMVTTIAFPKETRSPELTTLIKKRLKANALTFFPGYGIGLFIMKKKKAGVIFLSTDIGLTIIGVAGLVMYQGPLLSTDPIVFGKPKNEKLGKALFYSATAVLFSLKPFQMIIIWKEFFRQKSNLDIRPDVSLINNQLYFGIAVDRRH